MSGTSKDRNTPRERPPNPHTNANFLSKLTFWWLYKLISRSYRQRLVDEDIHQVHPSLAAQVITHDIEKIITPSLHWTLLKLFQWKLILTGLLALLSEVIKICQPLLVARLILYFKEDPTVSKNEAILFGVLLGLLSFAYSLPNNFYFHLSNCIALHANVACNSLIYRKSLRVRNSALSVISEGKVVHLLAYDARNFSGISFLHYLWIGPVELAVVMALLYRTVGLAFLPCLIYVVVMLPVQFGLGNIIARIRLETAGWTDERASIMGEIIHGMNVIKMYCWQKPFQMLISDKRRNEMKYIIRRMIMKGQTYSLCIVSPKLVTMAILVMYYLTGNDIDPATVIKVIGWTELLKQGGLLYFAEAAECCTGMYLSVCRIQEYLTVEEVRDVSAATENDISTMPESDIAVMLRNVKTTWETQLVKDLIKDEFAEMQAPPEKLMLGSFQQYLVFNTMWHINNGRLTALPSCVKCKRTKRQHIVKKEAIDTVP